jgi:hypothetical protein
VTYIRATVAIGHGEGHERHDIGWLADHGWFCTTCDSKRCRYIRTVKETIKP